MAMSIDEVKEWINGLTPGNFIAVDDGGLCLVEIDSDDRETGEYCEIGGIPEPDCRACDGTGEVGGEPCERCDGLGVDPDPDEDLDGQEDDDD